MAHKKSRVVAGARKRVPGSRVPRRKPAAGTKPRKPGQRIPIPKPKLPKVTDPLGKLPPPGGAHTPGAKKRRKRKR